MDEVQKPTSIPTDEQVSAPPIDDLSDPEKPQKPKKPVEDPEKRLQEALLELQSQKQRQERELQHEKSRLRVQLLADLFPVLDNLDRSIEAATKSPDQPLREGVRMIRDQFEQVLRGYGVESIDAQGKPFDPAEHEALAMLPVSNPKDHRRVLEVFRRGYRHDGKLLRASQVSVGDYRPEEASESPADADAVDG